MVHLSTIIIGIGTNRVFIHGYTPWLILIPQYFRVMFYDTSRKNVIMIYLHLENKWKSLYRKDISNCFVNIIDVWNLLKKKVKPTPHNEVKKNDRFVKTVFFCLF